MLKFICLFFPAVISVFIFDKLQKKPLQLRKIIYLYATNTVIINLLCILIKKLFLGTADNPISAAGMDMIPGVAFNYLIMAVPFAVLISVIETILARNINIKVEENQTDEKIAKDEKDENLPE